MTDINKLNHGQLPLFTIIFQNGSNFVGGNNYFETNWLNIPINKKIKRIFYRLPSNDCLCLEGYDSYFRMSEACKDLTGKNRDKIRIQYDYIMGIKGNKVRSYRITLANNKNDKFKMNDITTRIFDTSDKFIQGLNKENFRG